MQDYTYSLDEYRGWVTLEKNSFVQCICPACDRVNWVLMSDRPFQKVTEIV